MAIGLKYLQYSKDIATSIPTFDLVPKWNIYISFYDILFSTKNLIQSNTIRNNMVGVTETETINYLSVWNNLPILVKTVKLPELMVTVDSKKIGSSVVHVVKQSAVSSDLEITFFSDNKVTAKRLYYYWLNFMVNFETGTKSPRKIYEKDIKIIIGDRLDNELEKRTYHGCSPRSISGGEYEASETSYVDDVTITFKVNNGFTIDSKNYSGNK